MRTPARLRVAAVGILAGLCVNGPGLGSSGAQLSRRADLVPSAATSRPVSSRPGTVVLEVHGGIPLYPQQPIDAATSLALASELSRARTAAMRYPTVAAAKAAGFVEATGFTSGVGAHFLKFSDISGSFDVDHPAMILYDGLQPQSRVAGLAYYVISGVGTPPDGFAGANDHWHQHPGVCVTPTGPVLAGDASQTCRLGGRPAWMLHVWVAPTYPSPDGWFSPENRKLAIGGVTPSRYGCSFKT